MVRKWLAIPLVVAIGCGYSYHASIEDMFLEPTEVSADTVESEVAQRESVEDKILAACESYDVDYKLAIAIARLETGHFKSDAYRFGNNVGGLSINEVPICYETLDDGVIAFVENLAINYIDCGLTNPQEIAYKYCPPNPSGWAEVVTDLMYGGY